LLKIKLDTPVNIVDRYSGHFLTMDMMFSRLFFRKNTSNFPLPQPRIGAGSPQEAQR
jgi:hypothetical protein